MLDYDRRCEENSLGVGKSEPVHTPLTAGGQILGVENAQDPDSTSGEFIESYRVYVLIIFFVKDNAFLSCAQALLKWG